MPPPNGRGDQQFGVYVRAELLHAQDDLVWSSEVITADVKVEVGADVEWSDASFKWEYDADELAFLRSVASLFLKGILLTMPSFFRLLICHGNDTLAVFCARVEYLQQGWRLVYMLGMDGKELGTTMLVKFTITNLIQDDSCIPGGM